ncbi:MAG: AGE family epimerase/isomerase [Chloroflexota bacterium]
MINKLNKLRELATNELTSRILPFHMETMMDKQNGGFVGTISNDLTIDPNAPKGLVQCGRMLWSYSAAYRHFANEAYLKVAQYAFAELIGRFKDQVNGGFYWTLDANGDPSDKNKVIYGQAFAIYGLSEYFLATGDDRAQKEAIHLFRLLDQYAADHQHHGYWEACSETWTPNFEVTVDEIVEPAEKSMNTHLHMLEAYTNLLRIWDSDTLRLRLFMLIQIHLDYIVDLETAHMNLHFDKDWYSINERFSYGHDIEASWLLWEAAELLQNQQLIRRVKPIVLKMAEATLAEGIDIDGGIYDEAAPGEILSAEKHWWPQAEAMVGFLNAYQLTRNDLYIMAMFECWNFIQTQLVDREHGGWIWGIDRSGNPLDREKAGMWKTPYHNGRACLEIIHRVDQLQRSMTLTEESVDENLLRF